MESILEESIINLILKNSPTKIKENCFNTNWDLVLDLGFDKELLVNLFETLEVELKFKFIKTNLVTFPFLRCRDLIKYIDVIQNNQNNISLWDIHEYAKQKVNYYNKNFQDLTNKLYLSQNENSFLSKDYEAHYKVGVLDEKVTLGSTGIYIKCCWSLLDEILEQLFVRRRRLKWYNIKSTDKVLLFHSSIYAGNKLLNNKNIIESKYSLSIDRLLITPFRLPDFINQIINYRPIWITGEVSLLYILSLFIIKENLDQLKYIRYIELHGEELDIKKINIIVKAFPNAKIGNRYSSKETGVIALECPYHNLHIISETVSLYIKKSSENDKDGAIIVSNLINSSMPILNYYLEDYGRIEDSPCACGSSDPILKLSNAMNNHILMLKDYNLCNCKVLEYPIECINCEYNNPILQFQVVQQEINLFNVYIRIKNSFWNWKDTICESLSKCYKEHLGANWDIIALNSLESCEFTGIKSYFKSNL